MTLYKKKLYTKKLYGPFYWMGFKAEEPLRGGSLLFTSVSFQKLPGTHLIDVRKMKGWVGRGAAQSFWTQDLWIGNPAPKALAIVPY